MPGKGFAPLSRGSSVSSFFFRTPRQRARKKSTSWKLWLLRWTLYAAAAIVLVSLLLVVPLRWLEPPKSAFMLRYQEQGQKAPAHHWVELESISPAMARAVVAAEDQKFFVHHGFDLESIADALTEERPRGASTITQQTVKNLFLWPERSWLRKGIEAWLTLLAETFWPKKRILELYLNFAEFGRGIYGVDAAARSFYNLPPSRLSPYQAAQLTAVLPSPRRMSPRSPTPYLQQRTRHILNQMNLMGPLPL